MYSIEGDGVTIYSPVLAEDNPSYAVSAAQLELEIKWYLIE